MDPAFANISEVEFTQWDVPELNVADFLELETSQDADHHFSPFPSSFPHFPPVIDQPTQMGKAITSPGVSIPRSLTYTTRSLIHRPRMQATGQRSANLMLHTLVSYPRMMLRNKTLPPFIHPGLMSPDEGHDDMEPLNNCISLVNMISNGTRGARKLFWRNVRQECTRFCDEVC